MRVTKPTRLQVSAKGLTKNIDPNRGPLRLQIILFLIVLLSFAARLAALAYYGIPGTINSEGAEYARIAENLRNGVGYVGIATPGAQVNFPPLYPLLIAGTSFLTHSYEWAGSYNRKLWMRR
jgi:hypothetical protein